MKLKPLLIACLLLTGAASIAQSYEWKTATANGYSYKYVTNDPSKTRFYTLKNGLTVILSPNNQEPNIQFRMSVRAGSNTDPKNATGLAHYLEHLLFKGTDKFGTANWEMEKPLLDKIGALYEKYNKTTDPAQRQQIYKEIDKASGEASNFSIANEYDKMMVGIGGNSSNAHTWYEETVYNEDFPSNATDKFLAIQGERFRKPIFRIFHTELEAVYEEKNRTLDDDENKLDEAMMTLLFPTHNYGQQTTIGTIEHLKNPSLIEIRNYYNKYYVPNNMAAIFTGDFNPDEMIRKVEKAFSYMEPKPVTLYEPAPEKPLARIQRVDVNGPAAENVEIYYRGYAEKSREGVMLSIIQSILSNGKAGLIDINLNKQQKTQKAGARYYQMKDYGIFDLSAQPRQGQTLEQAADLLIGQIELLKKGEFDEQLIKAIAANQKLNFLQAFDSNNNRAERLSTEFILNRGTKWDQNLRNSSTISYTKAEIVAFANEFFKDNYVIGFKHKGTDTTIVKVEKPSITPINANASLTSEFVKSILEAPVAPLVPKFLDYKKDIAFEKTGNVQILTAKNKENDVFRMSYRFNMGINNDKLLAYAAAYLPFLGTDKYTAEEISRAFYTLACTYSLNVGPETTTVSISGLQENFDKALQLTEDIFSGVKPNEKALSNLKETILKSRENNKLDKRQIMNAMTSYAQYGDVNPVNNVLGNNEIMKIGASDLLDRLHNLFSHQHEITYYGPKDVAAFTKDIEKIHKLPKTFAPIPAAKVFTYTKQDENQVYFANYDMVQSEIFWSKNTGLYNKNDAAKIQVFNNYFGGGMGSIVFQTIRESKALAYSTYAYYVAPDKADKQYSMTAYVGSQADKMTDAVNGMNELLNVLPQSDKSFEGAKANVLNVLETNRVTKDGIFTYYFADRKLGYDYDSRIDLYKELKPITFESIREFHGQKIANKPYTYLILASDKKVKAEDMQKFGKVTTLTLEQLFGY